MSIPSRLARSLAGAFLTLLFVGSMAVAQIYVEPAPPRHYPSPRYTPVPGTGGYMTPPPRGSYDQRYEDYDQRPRRRVNPRDDYGYRDYRYEDSPRPRRRAAMGSVCVTSRGECSAGGWVPLGSGCYCRIPGFGRKAGNVRY
ncbi:MAG: hypothetical protein MUF11_01430 [Beijerinckiaceae bacterium]|jgi:hypothetical protein|nr:hypothetical protein [Beijerinckiaceae bacterium]